MQLRQWEYVAAIVRCKTMRKAAKELYVSEATISGQIQILEAELGFPLFDRGGRTLRLSAEGEKLLPDLQTFLDAQRDFSQSIAAVKNPAVRHIRLALSPYARMLFLNTIFRAFRKQYPQVSLDISEGGTYKLAEQVRNHVVDLAVFAMSDILPAHWDDLTLLSLCQTEAVPLASRHHALAHKENISKVRMANEISFDYSGDYISRDLFRTVLDIDEANIICSVNNPESFLSLIREGLGTMLIPRHILEAEHMEPSLRGLRMLDLAPDIHFPIYYACAYLRHSHIPEPVQALIAIIRECHTQISVHS